MQLRIGDWVRVPGLFLSFFRLFVHTNCEPRFRLASLMPPALVMSLVLEKLFVHTNCEPRFRLASLMPLALGMSLGLGGLFVHTICGPRFRLASMSCRNSCRHCLYYDIM